MDEANEGKRNLSGMEKLSLQTNRDPRDLLQRFMASNPSQLAETNPGNDEEEEEDIELNLGLSMGGRFGVDKTAKKKLMRSSSIAGSIPIVRDRGDNEVAPPPVSNPILIRTSSLPAETEEEWRKRKELQTLRRMVAKRRRSEKQRNMKGEKDGSGGSLGEERRCGLPTWTASVARQALIPGSKGNYMGGGGGGGVVGVGVGVGGCGGGGGTLQPSVSMESLGGSSSVMSESESRPFQGSSSCSEASPTSIQSLQEAGGSSGTKRKGKNASKSTGGETEEEEVGEKRLERREMGLNSLEDMPGVFTQGEGPNGRRIEGILYRYGKGEEVKIICICHGNFLSPAEFVKHAGGSNVAHPLKHIVVNPSSSLS